MTIFSKFQNEIHGKRNKLGACAIEINKELTRDDAAKGLDRQKKGKGRSGTVSLERQKPLVFVTRWGGDISR